MAILLTALVAAAGTAVGVAAGGLRGRSDGAVQRDQTGTRRTALGRRRRSRGCGRGCAGCLHVGRPRPAQQLSRDPRRRRNSHQRRAHRPARGGSDLSRGALSGVASRCTRPLEGGPRRSRVMRGMPTATPRGCPTVRATRLPLDGWRVAVRQGADRTPGDGEPRSSSHSSRGSRTRLLRCGCAGVSTTPRWSAPVGQLLPNSRLNDP